jgi:hypothetical protein
MVDVNAGAGSFPTAMACKEKDPPANWMRGLASKELAGYQHAPKVRDNCSNFWSNNVTGSLTV